ncbi:MAG: hypothetical protein QNK11_03865, partial [Legionella sp.]|nr:hypothetical protein [Legionella sp.]
SLIAAAILIQYAMTITEKEISLYKAARIFVKNIKNIKNFLLTLSSDSCFTWLIQKIKCYAIKETTFKRPSNKQALGVAYA